jgi:hypothetical protein
LEAGKENGANQAQQPRPAYRIQTARQGMQQHPWLAAKRVADEMGRGREKSMAFVFIWSGLGTVSGQVPRWLPAFRRACLSTPLYKNNPLVGRNCGTNVKTHLSEFPNYHQKFNLNNAYIEVNNPTSYVIKICLSIILSNCLFQVYFFMKETQGDAE